MAVPAFGKVSWQWGQGPDKPYRSFKCVHRSGQPHSSLKVDLLAIAWPQEIRVNNMDATMGKMYKYSRANRGQRGCATAEVEG